MLITTSSLREFSSSARKNTSRSHEGFHIKYSRQITARTTREKGEGKKKNKSKPFSCFNKGAKKVNAEQGRCKGREMLPVAPRGSAAAERQRRLGFSAGAAPAEPTRGAGHHPQPRAKAFAGVTCAWLFPEPPCRAALITKNKKNWDGECCCPGGAGSRWVGLLLGCAEGAIRAVPAAAAGRAGGRRLGASSRVVGWFPHRTPELGLLGLVWGAGWLASTPGAASRAGPAVCIAFCTSVPAARASRAAWRWSRGSAACSPALGGAGARGAPGAVPKPLLHAGSCRASHVLVEHRWHSQALVGEMAPMRNEHG